MEINPYDRDITNQPVLKESSVSKDRVLQVFLNSDMRCNEPGLTIIAKKNGIDATKLQIGQYLIFINRSQTMLKVFAFGRVIASYRSPHGRLEPLMLVEIPKAFKGVGMNFDAPLKAALFELLKKYRRRRVDTEIINSRREVDGKVVVRKPAGAFAYTPRKTP
jgi:hypothetical protein